ncbi:hypothetical protein IR083_07610 [Dysgonomonas sp. GY75]|uniref:hypothetical protein n=1 Tax=Dysgonomonas sp. GY75 TaxID=2780419 RepID=UPI0018841017|nr:hypothetical protein [Dysgonomonas sp. GY75]MBF0648683.1 hypothetical protein [Dysgonomonas sp. GY75]
MTLNRIINRTGRRETECNCELCQRQCKIPCLGTPDDILKLLEAGYRDKLSFSQWMVGVMLGKFPLPVPMVQACRTEEGCVFFKDGLCELHALGLKPAEGKLSHHSTRLDNFIFESSISWNVAREWLDMCNYKKVIRIFFLMDMLK